jgi:hypothetical protein
VVRDGAAPKGTRKTHASGNLALAAGELDEAQFSKFQ